MERVKIPVFARFCGQHGRSKNFYNRETTFSNTKMADKCQVSVKIHRIYNTKNVTQSKQQLMSKDVISVGSLIITNRPLWCWIWMERRGGYASVQVQVILELPIFSVHLDCQSENVLNIKLVSKNNFILQILNTQVCDRFILTTEI